MFLASRTRGTGEVAFPKFKGDRRPACTHERSTISIFTPSGTWMRMSCRNARSSASRSMSLLWIRISQRSHVSLPSPSGDFRTGTSSRFVGSGIGPAIATPVRSLISLICWHTLSTFFGSVPLSEMRAFWGMVQPGERKQKATGSALLDFDDLTRRDGLPHVPDREAPHLRERLERLDDEGFRRSDLDAGRVAGLEEVGLLGLRRARLRIEHRDDLLEGACDLGRVRVEDRRVPGRDDARMVQDDDLRGEGLRDRRRVVRRSRDVAPAEVLLFDPAHVEADVVAWFRLRDLLVVHLDRLDLADLVRGHEVDLHPDFQEAGLDPADGHGAGARDRVDVLDREAEREVRRLRRHRQVVEGRHEGGALVPGHLRGRLRDVLALVRADRDERDPVHLEARDLQQAGQLGLQFGEALLRILRLRRVHLVDRHDDLLDPEDLREVDVLLRLRLHALRRPDDEDRGVRLGRAGDHVLDEVPVARGVYDREVVLVRVKTLVRDIDRQAALALLLALVHDERELERGLAHLLGELLEVLEFVRVDIPGVVEDPADGRRLPVVDVADEHEVEVWLRGHGFYPVGRTLSSCHIYAYPTRAIFSIGNERMEDGTDLLSAEAEAGRLDDVFMGPRDLRLARTAQVDERQFLPRRRMANVGGAELAAEQEFEIPVVRRTREPLRRVDLRDHRGTGEREVGQLELLPSNASGSIVGRFAKDQMGRRKHPAVRVRLDARWIEGTDMVPRGLWIHVAHEDLS